MGVDTVGVVELAYDLEATDDAWLRALVVAASPDLDRGFGMFGMLFGDAGFAQPAAMAVIGNPSMTTLSAELMSDASPAVVNAFTMSTAVTSMRNVCSSLGAHELQRWDQAARRRGVRDMVGVIAHDGEGGAINLAAVSPRCERVSAAERARWTRIAAHFGAAVRMRRHRGELGTTVEAVLSRTGRIEHVDESLRDDRESTAVLQESTRNMARARGPLRRDEERALSIWPSMVSGRWTLVERTERDGKRHVEAHANMPRRPPLADLTPLERACVELARRGHANKQIAYALGLSLGTVGGTLSAAMRKVGVRSRIGLIALGDAPSFGEVVRVLGAMATRAEVAVAALAVAGMSNAQIAEQRGVAPRTIANQLARLFERVGVSSRAELAVLVQAGKHRG